MDTFEFNQQKILKIVSALPPEIKKEYPAHILDPIRIEIARELALKEFYKLFPFLSSGEFTTLGDTMLEWLHGKGFELAPVHDYWNYLDGMMLGLKLKDIIPQLTSAHITWRQGKLDPKLMQLYWPVGNLSSHGKGPYNYQFVHTHIIAHKKELDINKKISDEKASDTTVSRDQYPIIVRRNRDNTLTLMDGNRRVMRSWLYQRPTILAWVGTIKKEPLLQDHWVSTGFLRRLLSEYAAERDDAVASSLRSQLEVILPSSSIARLHYKKRCLSHYPFAAELAKGLLT